MPYVAKIQYHCLSKISLPKKFIGNEISIRDISVTIKVTLLPIKGKTLANYTILIAVILCQRKLSNCKCQAISIAVKIHHFACKESGNRCQKVCLSCQRSSLAINGTSLPMERVSLPMFANSLPKIGFSLAKIGFLCQRKDCHCQTQDTGNEWYEFANGKSFFAIWHSID